MVERLNLKVIFTEVRLRLVSAAKRRCSLNSWLVTYVEFSSILNHVDELLVKLVSKVILPVSYTHLTLPTKA